MRTWEEWQEIIEKVKQNDREKIERGELKQSDLFWIDAERARNAKITWNFGKKRNPLLDSPPD